MAEDGLEIKENIDFRFVTSPYQAQRLAHQYLRRKRLARRVQLKMNLDGYAYRPGQVVRLNLPTLGITDLEFRVIDWRFSALDGAELTLEEDGAYVYEDVIGKPFERPPFTRLPVGGVGAPISLNFIPQTLGDVIQGILSWRNVSEVAFNRVAIFQDDRIIQTIQVPGESVNISGLVRGNYRAEVRAVNAAGAMSAPAVFEFSIQAPPPPVNVEITPGFFSLTIVPRQGDVASFGHTFEFWFSEKQLDFTHESAVINHADRLGQGNFWIKDQLKAGTTYWFYIRTINTYGKSPFIEGSGQPNDNTTEIVEKLGNQFLTAEAGKRLQSQLDYQAEAALINGADIYRNAHELIVKDGENKAEIRRLNRVFADSQTAWAQQITEVKAEIQNDIKASVSENKKAITKVDSALAESEQRTQAQFKEQSAVISSKMQAEFSQNAGYAIHSVNITINRNGTKYNAGGMVISGEFKNGNLESYIGFSANNFAFFNPANGKLEPFMAVKNCQVFIRDAFIENGSITNAKISNASITMAKIADGLRSDNWPYGGWNLPKSGAFEMRSSASGARVALDHTGLAVFDGSGILRVKVGKI
ncbi:host specificity protein J [Xenorhabdus eapokensis]|uniref:Host specificity protein J n=1 Tax=Xenorhabdus eapokensis TaxID=1873482 RepID=A0A1Q5TPC2_9GAMM|nr:host specificity protein J [Xenorhabdus eapokensis]